MRGNKTEPSFKEGFLVSFLNLLELQVKWIISPENRKVSITIPKPKKDV